MTLRTFALIFVIAVLGLFAALSYSLIRTSDYLDESAHQLSLAAESIHSAQALKSRMLTHNRNAFLYALTRDPERQENSRAQRLQIEQLMDSLQSFSNSTEEDTLLMSMESEVTAYLGARSNLDQISLMPVEEYNQISQFVDNAIVAVDALIELNRSQLGQLIADVERQNTLADRIAYTLLILGGLLLIFMLAAIMKLVTLPLIELSRIMTRYGRGESEVRSEVRGLREIRQFERNFNEMADLIKMRREEQLQIISLIAHDLRSPLHAVSMSLQVLALDADSKQKETLHLVDQQMKYLDQLVEDFLDAGRIESGSVDLKFIDTDIRPLLSDVVAIYRSGDHAHEFLEDIPRQALLCHCDPQHLRRVFSNLVSNAVKYSPEGGTVRVSAETRDGQIIVSVSDEGIGIAQEDQQRIFEPFFRTTSSQQGYPGIGLGLSSARRLVEAHEGRVEVQSEVGKGTTFHVILPLLTRNEAAEPLTYAGDTA